MDKDLKHECPECKGLFYQATTCAKCMVFTKPLISKTDGGAEVPCDVGLWRTLDMGEIIQEGDEGSSDQKTWMKITRDDPWGWVIGMQVCVMVPHVRRAP